MQQRHLNVIRVKELKRSIIILQNSVFLKEELGLYERKRKWKNMHIY